jgi:SAM-dependent methyltransferase
MHTELIKQHYDEVIAPHYDLDPQSVIHDSLVKAIAQLRPYFEELRDSASDPAFDLLDIGMGTGLFLEKLRANCSVRIQPFGIDLSEKMIDIARTRIPDLVAEVGDAANLDEHFPSESFEVIATHYITGFVPLKVLGPSILKRLQPGGVWSLVGGTKAGFPALREKAQAKSLRWLFGGRSIQVDDLVCNPADLPDALRTLRECGFEIVRSESFTPQLRFSDLNEFLEFAYWGGWLTPFVESLGLHKARRVVRALLNKLVFPIEDHHSIAIVLARKPL